MADLKEALHCEPLAEGKVACHLCPQECKIAPGNVGFCGVRRNVDGVLCAELYGQVAAVQMDPIEKKPLYHFHPGAAILSIGNNGCNLRCQWCQNWHLSNGHASTRDAAPAEVVALAQEHGSIGIAYTYNEPLVGFEYVLDCSRLAAEAGLVNVLVTNGYANAQPLAELLPHVDALNVDLKSIKDEDYRRYAKGRLAPVQHTIREAAKCCHLEVTNLVVTGVNDSRDDLVALVEFVASVDRSIPLHFSRYFPNFNFDAPATSESTMRLAYEIGCEALDYVYVGNIALSGASDTRCPGCGRVLIERSGYSTRVVGTANRVCSKCGATPNIVW